MHPGSRRKEIHGGAMPKIGNARRRDTQPAKNSQAVTEAYLIAATIPEIIKARNLLSSHRTASLAKGIEKSAKPRIWRRALTLFILQDNQLSHTVKARLRGISG